MLTAKEIKKLFSKLNALLEKRRVRGEIGIVGGAAMCLVFNARGATKDVDAVFEPSSIIRDMAKQLAAEEDIPSDWLNDSVKVFMTAGFERRQVLEFSHLTVWAPEPKYLLAMKCLSARFDSSDGDDIRFLIRFLKLSMKKEAFDIIEGYYPQCRIPAKTAFFLEELFQNL